MWKTNRVFKLLDTPEGWDLKDCGQISERFVHDSGWWFYTGLNFVSLSLDHQEVNPGELRYLWYKYTNKEDKFLKAWLDFNGKEVKC